MAVRFDGAVYDLPEGANLAAALLVAGVRAFRATPISGAPRAPFCMMGACYDCLVRIDGVVRQACMTRVQAGMEIERAPAREVPHG
ncbi:2Fe-2S iron-sulfur cluster-binding protein [Rhodovulum imhoffii]|uniref:2Fe-2S iron-sulfur cluster-binding protein n=1 Tax=Rhodovulum imhoffii TaxID=365340 RepID=UPI001FD08F1E|nr:2Fe-2S iron-sulfur cluster-binding protein [Rhodovulum imhoffii]